MAGGQWRVHVGATGGVRRAIEESAIMVPILSLANLRGKPATYGGDISPAFSTACGETSGFGGLTR